MTIATSIELPRQIYDGIVAHAREGAPQEICGILSGIDGRATELVRAQNEAENPVMDYWVDGQTLLRQFDFEDQGEAMIAIYHSHPVDEAYPSATDARNAYYPDATYLICSLLQPDQPTLRAYRLLSKELDQRPAELLAVRGNPDFLAHHHRDDTNDTYDLLVRESDGRERWQRVEIIEQDVVVRD
ncbi:MAG: M67 family metallopeptidase [Chloroflexota bacterium]|nr:M67 family metallopeptidase [Chloroflexota bacterium]